MTGPGPDGRVDRFPPPYSGGWCRDARDDPITGLIAWPGFYDRFPALVSASIRAGTPVGLAIGDVDGLKAYVESARRADPESFGHLAGNAVMRRLGEVARDWWLRTSTPQGCLATFGGDEIVLAVELSTVECFTGLVCELRDRLGDTLPCTVSFAATVVLPAHVPPGLTGDEWIRGFCTHLIGEVDRALFTRKQARRRDGRVPAGEVVVVDLSAPRP